MTQIPELLTIAVAAGKGGTGKTLVATSLAETLQTSQHGVELLDCDVEEPNAHLLLRPRVVYRQPVTILVPQVNKQTCTRCKKCVEVCQFSAIAVIREAVLAFPDLCAGCGACAFVCPVKAITEVERVVGTVEQGVTEAGIDMYTGRVNVGDVRSGPVIHAVKQHTHTDRLTIIDAPPGTACPMQESIKGVDYCLLVTEPTPFGLSDLGAAVDTCRQLTVPCGVIINRDGVGDARVEEYCDKEGLPVLLRIPHDRRIAEAYSRGETLTSALTEWRALLAELYDRIAAALAIHRKEARFHATR
ncbi:MAG: ATP-binding protein [Candidatus Zipacnadales bacterium]